MNEVYLWHQLTKAIPASVCSKIAYVFERQYWPEVEVGFYTGRSVLHVVVIPKNEWLNDATIARLCLEAP
jgi:hypothetical protein